MPPDISVIIPFFNEQDNVLPLLAEIADSLAGVFEHEVIAVDDGSTDETPDRLQQAASGTGTLKIVRLPRNSGQSCAIANGVFAARAPLIVTLDGDGQNPPDDIPTLIHAYRKAHSGQFLLVIGWRKSRRDNGLRRLSSKVANAVRQRLLRDDCPDTGCGLRAFARESFLQLPRFNHMHRFMPALFRRAGGQVLVVPVGHRPRQTGVSKYGIRNRLWVGLIDLFGVAWLLMRPLRIYKEVLDDQRDI